NPPCPVCPLDFEADGKTVVLTLRAPLNPGVPNHLKLAIADARDGQIDSWAFIEPAIFAVPEVCTNGRDDDLDGLTDHDDPDCFMCANRILDPGEECDDGNLAPGDGCGPDCRLETRSTIPTTTTTTTTLPPAPCAGVDCDDRNPCTADACDPVAGCVHDPVP